MATVPIYIIIGVFIVGVIAITALFLLKVGPYGQVYQFKDPRTWKPVADNSAWLNTTFNYQSNDRNIPTPEIKNVYCKYDPNRCIPDESTFLTKGSQTCALNASNGTTNGTSS